MALAKQQKIIIISVLSLIIVGLLVYLLFFKDDTPTPSADTPTPSGAGDNWSGIEGAKPIPTSSGDECDANSQQIPIKIGIGTCNQWAGLGNCSKFGDSDGYKYKLDGNFSKLLKDGATDQSWPDRFRLVEEDFEFYAVRVTDKNEPYPGGWGGGDAGEDQTLTVCQPTDDSSENWAGLAGAVRVKVDNGDTCSSGVTPTKITIPRCDYHAIHKTAPTQRDVNCLEGSTYKIKLDGKFSELLNDGRGKTTTDQKNLDKFRLIQKGGDYYAVRVTENDPNKIFKQRATSGWSSTGGWKFPQTLLGCGKPDAADEE